MQILGHSTGKQMLLSLALNFEIQFCLFLCFIGFFFFANTNKKAQFSCAFFKWNIFFFYTIFNKVPFANTTHQLYMSRLIRKPTICICENKGADQLRSNCKADQRFCFRYTNSTIPLLSKSKISSL